MGVRVGVRLGVGVGHPNPTLTLTLTLTPTLYKAGCTDAGHFILELQCYPQLYANFLVERRQSWDEEPLQEVSRSPNPYPNPTRDAP